MKIIVFTTMAMQSHSGYLFDKQFCKVITDDFWKRKDENIFAYKCLSDKELLRNNNFITDILKKVCDYYNIGTLEHLFQNEIYLVLHDKDIGLKKNDYALTESEITQIFLTLNNELISVFKKATHPPHIFVFQHVIGIISGILSEINSDNKHTEAGSLEKYILQQLDTLQKKNNDLFENPLFPKLFFFFQYYLLIYFFSEIENPNFQKAKDILQIGELDQNEKKILKNIIIGSFLSDDENSSLFEEKLHIVSNEEKLKRKRTNEEKQKIRDEIVIQIIKDKNEAFIPVRIILDTSAKELLKIFDNQLSNNNEGLRHFANNFGLSKSLSSVTNIINAYKELSDLLDFENHSNVSNPIWESKDLYEHTSFEHFISELGDFSNETEIDVNFFETIKSWKDLSANLRIIIETSEAELNPKVFLNTFPTWITLPILEFWKLRYHIATSVNISLEHLSITDRCVDSIECLFSENDIEKHNTIIRNTLPKLINSCKVIKKHIIRLFTSIRYQECVSHGAIEIPVSENNAVLPKNGIVIVIDDVLGNVLDSKNKHCTRGREIFLKKKLGIEYHENNPLKVYFLSGQKFVKNGNKVLNENTNEIIRQIRDKEKYGNILCFLLDLYFKEGTWNYERGEVTNTNLATKFGVEIAKAISGIHVFDSIPIILMSSKDEPSQKDKDLHLKNVKDYIPKTYLTPQKFATVLAKYQYHTISEIIENQKYFKVVDIMQKCLEINRIKKFDPDTCFPIETLENEEISLLTFYYVRKVEKLLQLNERLIDINVFNILYKGKGKNLAFSTTKQLEYIIKYILVKYPTASHFTVYHLKSYPHFSFIEPELATNDTERIIEAFIQKADLFVSKFKTKDSSGKVNWIQSGKNIQKAYPEFKYQSETTKLIQDEFRRQIYELYKEDNSSIPVYLKLIKDHDVFKQWFFLLKTSNYKKHKELFKIIEPE